MGYKITSTMQCCLENFWVDQGAKQGWPGAGRRSQEEQHPPLSPYLARISSIWLFPSYMLSNKLIVISKVSSAILAVPASF